MGANAQIAVPAFTAGQVLTATQQTQINTGIPVFATTTTRDAAFGGTGEKTLAQGQYCFIELTNTLQVYTGSAWVTATSGLVYITSGTVTAGSALSFDNCFSATYANYLIMLTHTGGNNPTMRLRAGGADITAANYDFQGFYITGGSQTITNSNSQTSWVISNSTGYSQPMIQLGNPFAATNTTLTLNYQRADTSILQLYGGRYAATTSADGFSILATSLTVTARVYGYLNS